MLKNIHGRTKLSPYQSEGVKKRSQKTGMTTSLMDANLETAAKEGDVAYLDRFHVKNRETENGETTSESSFLGQTPEGDNILHLAAKRNRYSFIEKALQKIPAVVLLICRSNSRGENPLHIAAQLGHLDIVQVLVDSYKTHLRDVKDMKFRSTLLSLMVVEEGTSPDPWIAQDSSGNTPLHEALRSGYEEVAMYLLQVEPKLADSVNNAAEGILFLAAAYGHEQVLEMILTSEVPYSLSSPAGLTPLHALIHNCSEGAAQILLRKHPELAKRADKHKQTAIYYAAVANKDRHVEVILKTDKSCAYLKDENGFTPLLIAASLGQLKAVHTILLHCPESITICDTNCMTALHLMKLESYEEGIEVLMNPAMRRLINEPDLEGNTPLHLAVKNSDHVKAKVILDMDKTGINLRNKNGDTPWDLTKQQKELSEDMVKIGYDLIMHSSDKHKPTHQETENQPPMIHQTVHSFQEANKITHNNFSIVALIAAILAAVTFAAGFLVPGGFDINGHAVLTRVTAFKVFILSNTTAMCGYTFVLFSALSTMMLGQRDDKPRYLLSFSIHILQLSFYATLIAFVSIMYALTSANSLWLAIVLVCLPPCAVFLTFSKSLIFRLVRFFSKLWM